MLTPDGYMERIIDSSIDRLLRIYGAVCIEGPKWSGKTWTSRNHSSSASFLGDSAGNFKNRMLAELDPALVLEGEQPKLIDEWQTVPPIWDAVRYKVDETGRKGQFILTESSTPVLKGILHGGTGRIGKITMRTMSLYEMGKSTGDVSIMDLFNGNIKNTPVPQVHLDTLIEYVLRGGWPGVQNLSLEDALEVTGDYLENIPNDMQMLDGIRRDKRKVKAVLRALGRAESNMTSRKSLQKDIEEFSEDRNTVSVDSISDYLDCFSRLFLTEDQPSFENKLRSSVKALKSPKRHFADPSLAAAAINATKETLKNDLNTFGYLFEALCIHDLRVYASAIGAKVFHYHDEKENEVDAVLELPDGRWGLVEIKVGFNQVEKAAEQLISLKEKFTRETSSTPQFLCIICGLSSAILSRPDGVYVIPITAFGP